MLPSPQRVQLHRALSKAGLASRTEAAKAIRAGLVRVNGRITRDPLAWVSLGTDRILLAGQQTPAEPNQMNHRHLMLHKPKGPVVTRSDELGRQTVHALLPDASPRVEAIGRLDADSEGLLLFTSDSVLASHLLAPGRKVPKIYRLTVRGLPTEEALAKLCEGIDLPGDLGRTMPCQARLLRSGAEKSVVELILTEGKNRQARRMLAAVGHKVLRLVRQAFGPIHLDNLPPGQWRDLTPGEAKSLYQAAGLDGKSK
ncbi:MAG: pseudouridine synthase [Gemmataceae bacterium]